MDYIGSAVPLYEGGKGALKVVVVGQLLPCHDALVAGEQGHARLALNRPLLHAAVGLARVVDKPRDRPASCVNDHVLIEIHQVVALCYVSGAPSVAVTQK